MRPRKAVGMMCYPVCQTILLCLSTLVFQSDPAFGCTGPLTPASVVGTWVGTMQSTGGTLVNTTWYFQQLNNTYQASFCEGPFPNGFSGCSDDPLLSGGQLNGSTLTFLDGNTPFLSFSPFSGDLSSLTGSFSDGDGKIYKIQLTKSDCAKSCVAALSPNSLISSLTPGYMNQTDKKWGTPSPHLGLSADTIAHGGCLLTALAMAINTADPNDQKTLNPPLTTLAPLLTEFVTPPSLNTFLTSGFPPPYVSPLSAPHPTPTDPHNGGQISSPDIVARMVSASRVGNRGIPGRCSTIR